MDVTSLDDTESLIINVFTLQKTPLQNPAEAVQAPTQIVVSMPCCMALHSLVHIILSFVNVFDPHVKITP